MAVQEVELIDNAALLPPNRRPTPRMVGYLLLLAGDRLSPRHGSCGKERTETVHALVMERPLDRSQVGQLIDWYKVQPRDRSDEPTGPEGAPVTEPGVFERPDDKVFVVKWNREQTHLYAKRAVPVPSERLMADGSGKKIDFEYAPGALRTLREGMRMDLERARELSVQYGACIRCGRTLKVKASVERMLGPVCVKYFRVI